MSAVRTILRNVLSNSLGYVVNVLVALLLTPFVYRHLGREVYGIWTLIFSLTGYYGLLDLGIRSAVGHYVAVYWARRDMDQVNRTMNTARILMLIAAAISLAVTLALFFLFPLWKPDAVAKEPKVVWAILIMGSGFAMSFPMALYSTVIYARQRIDLQNAVGISQRLLSAGLTVLLLERGYGLLGLAVAVMGTNLIAWMANIGLAYSLMPDLKFRREFCKVSFSELKGYGIFNFIVNAADNILVYTDAVVIGIFVPALSAVTVYQVGANLIPYYMSIVLAITWSITPYATACYATGDFAALRRLMAVGTRGALVLATIIAGGLLLLGHDFINIWIGDERLLSGRPYTSSAVILAILTTATLLRATQSCGRQLLFAMQEVKFLGFVALAEAGANLVLSIILVKFMGIAGVAIATLVPILITQGLIQPLYLNKKLNLSTEEFFFMVLRTVVPILVTMDLIYYAYARHLPAESWLQFVWKATVIAAPAVVVGVYFGLQKDERRKLFLKLGLVKESAPETANAVS